MFERFFTSERVFRFLLATGALLLVAIPVGIACFGLGFGIGENPCIMCWVERFAMVYLGVLLMMMLRYGVRTRYLAAYAFWAFAGLYFGLRHTGNLIWRDIGQGFGSAILGAHTYSWAVFVYWLAVLSLFFILLFMRKGQPAVDELAGHNTKQHDLKGYPKVVVIFSFIVILANAFQAFLENGLPPNLGKGRPARLTMDLSMASKDWNTKLWGNFVKPATLRGMWGTEKPWIAGINEKQASGFSSDPSAGPIAVSSDKLELLGKHVLPFKPEGWNGESAVTGVAWQPAMRKYGFVTGNAGIYYTDESFSKMTDRAILDYPNGNDLVSSVDATFMGTKLIGLAYNKTIYGSELVDPAKVDKWWQWRIYREATPGFTPVWGFNRPWLGTARAKLSYVTAAAYDGQTNSLYVVSAPNQFQKNTVLMTFDMADKTVVAERNLKPADGVQAKNPGKPLPYYLSGLAVLDGKLIALSRNFLSLLVIDPATARVEKAIALPAGLTDPHSLTIADGKLVCLGREAGKDVAYELSLPSVK